MKSAPRIEARSSTVRSAVGRRSMRDASSDRIVGGTSTASASTVSRQVSPSRRMIASSTSMRTSSRTNSGLPSVDSGSRASSSAGRPSVAEHPRRQLGGGLGVEAVEDEDVAHPAAGFGQRRAQVAELGTGEAHEQDRRPAHPLGQVLEQIEEERRRPLDVVDRR